MNSTDNEQYQGQCQEMVQLATAFLPLEFWNFHLSARIPQTYSIVIYDSDWCRVKFMWHGKELYVGNTIGIYYGRLHALNDNTIMIWNNEVCHCWHRIENALRFLDGMSPREAVEDSNRRPRIMEQFQQSELGKSLTGVRRQPEWLMRMHAAVWKHYGQPLFELFDLRRPDLWEQYTLFISEFYEIKGLIPDITPAEDKIC